MKFWQAVAFLETDQLLEVAQAADRLGFDSIAVSDHVPRPKERKSGVPVHPHRRAVLVGRHAVARPLGADQRDGRGDDPAEVLHQRLHRAGT